METKPNTYLCVHDTSQNQQKSHNTTGFIWTCSKTQPHTSNTNKYEDRDEIRRWIHSWNAY